MLKKGVKKNTVSLNSLILKKQIFVGVNYTELFKKINHWDDFTSSLEQLNKKEKGNAFELLTKLYFKLSPKYSFYDEVWMLSEVPVSVIDRKSVV